MLHSHKAGFTLLELSIVIVIIGLIVAGISAGQSLVRQAQIRSLVSAMNNWKVATNAFLLQYDALPGDISNAYDYWGTALSCTDALATNGSAGCNGDGDKIIENNAGSSRDEGFRAWQQLGHTGLLDGSYNGNISGGFFPCTAGVTVPEALGATSGAVYGGDTVSFPDFIQIGTGTNCSEGIMSPPETASLDSKIDDGVPVTGNFSGGNHGSCYSGSTYTLSETSTSACRLFYSYK